MLGVFALIPILFTGALNWQGTPMVDPGPPQAPVDMTAGYDVLDSNRLALTPMLDGKLDSEEWDALCVNTPSPSYLQWEPGAIFIAAQIPAGKDIIFSLDLRGDGWLVGNDNLEVRASWADGAPVIKARSLDAVNRNAPIWQYAPLIEGLIRSAGIEVDGGWTLELRLSPLDMPGVELGRTIGVRSDAVDKGTATPEPFAPRTTTLVTMRYDRGTALPIGTSWSPQYAVRTVTPGDAIKIRLNFVAKATPFKRIELRSEGLASGATKLVALPFPEVDRKGRAFVDYETPIASDATRGFRILRGTLVGLDGQTTTIQTTYRVAELLDIEVTMPSNLETQPDTRVIRGHVLLRSNSAKRLNGDFWIEVPPTWGVSKNKQKRFSIYHNRGTLKIPVELIAPQRATGLIPVIFRTKVGAKESQQTYYLPIR